MPLRDRIKTSFVELYLWIVGITTALSTIRVLWDQVYNLKGIINIIRIQFPIAVFVSFVFIIIHNFIRWKRNNNYTSIGSESSELSSSSASIDFESDINDGSEEEFELSLSSVSSESSESSESYSNSSFSDGFESGHSLLGSGGQESLSPDDIRPHTNIFTEAEEELNNQVIADRAKISRNVSLERINFLMDSEDEPEETEEEKIRKGLENYRDL